MMTWTCKFDGIWLEGCAVVTADDVELAVTLLKKELESRKIPAKITNDMMVPMVTSTRKVRILSDGDY